MTDWRDRVIEVAPPEGSPQHDAWTRAKHAKRVMRKLVAVVLLAGLIFGLQQCAQLGRSVTEEAEGIKP